MPTKVQVDGVGVVEFDDSFKSLSPAEQQAAVDEVANGHASGRQLSKAGAAFMNQSAAAAPASNSEIASRPLPSHTGFGRQVADAIGSGPTPTSTLGDVGQAYATMGLNYGVGAAGQAAGFPGDIETIGRTLANSLGAQVSPTSAMPTTARMENYIGGPSSGTDADIGRLYGEVLGPSMAYAGAKALARGTGTLTSHALGLITGSGGRAVSEAAGAGMAGGAHAETFLANLRNPDANLDDVVQMAKDAVDELHQAKTAEYLRGIKSTIGSPSRHMPQPLNFQAVDRAVIDAAKVGTFKGESLSAGADKVRSTIHEVVSEWGKLDPAEFHTAEGLDALKKKIGYLGHEGELKSVAGPHTPGKLIIDKVYNTIKDLIVKEYPEYAKVMKSYSEASDALRNIEGELSLGKSALPGTSVRKLQSIMRNNVNTGYGMRTGMVEGLDHTGAASGQLMPALAGQALSSPTPRGIQGAIAGHGGMIAALTNPAAWPAIAAYGAASSPRLVGEGAYYTGKGLGLVPSMPSSRLLMLQPSLALRASGGPQ